MVTHDCLTRAMVMLSALWWDALASWLDAPDDCVRDRQTLRLRLELHLLHEHVAQAEFRRQLTQAQWLDVRFLLDDVAATLDALATSDASRERVERLQDVLYARIETVLPAVNPAAVERLSTR